MKPTLKKSAHPAPPDTNFLGSEFGLYLSRLANTLSRPALILREKVFDITSSNSGESVAAKVDSRYCTAFGLVKSTTANFPRNTSLSFLFVKYILLTQYLLVEILSFLTKLKSFKWHKLRGKSFTIPLAKRVISISSVSR